MNQFYRFLSSDISIHLLPDANACSINNEPVLTLAPNTAIFISLNFDKFAYQVKNIFRLSKLTHKYTSIKFYSTIKTNI